jgi:hypothetical protein
VDNNTDRSHKAHQQLGGSRVHVAVLVSIANLGCNLLDFQSIFFSQWGILKVDILRRMLGLSRFCTSGDSSVDINFFELSVYMVLK